MTEGEDKPLKYPTAFGLAHLVVVTKSDIAEAVSFDEAEFRANVERINPGVEVVLTSARAGEGDGVLLDPALAARDGAPVHIPVMTRKSHHVHDAEDGQPCAEGAHDEDHGQAPRVTGGHTHRTGPGTVASSRS